MDIQDYIKKIQYLKESLPKRLNENVYPEIAESITNEYKNRIFSKGLDSNESKIGDYSEKPMNATKEQFVKKAAFTSTSKSGKTMKLKGGYKELKQVQGLKSDSVNLLYSGDLKNSITHTNISGGFVIGFSSVEDSEKANKLEEKYGKVIFQFTEKEKEKIQKQVASVLKKSFQQW